MAFFFFFFFFSFRRWPPILLLLLLLLFPLFCSTANVIALSSPSSPSSPFSSSSSFSLSSSSSSSSASSSSSSASSFLPLSTPSMPPAQVFLINLILLTNHLNLPPSSTIFLPLNQSIAVAFPSPRDLDTSSYHIITSRYTFKDLLLLDRVASSSRLQTLLLDRTVRINRSGMSLLADDREIVAPDLYSDDNLVIHGIARALDPDFYMSQSSSASRISPYIPGG